MEYTNSTVADYLNTDSFVRWVLYSENDAYWQRIRSLHPNQHTVIEQARQLVSQLHEAQNQTNLPVNEARTWAAIRETINTDPYRPTINRTRRLWQTPLFRWAAAFVCIIGIGWFTVNYQKPTVLSYNSLVAAAKQEEKLVEQVNTSGHPVRLTLEDGSIVTLAKNACLSYPARFDAHRREVILSGEAFFEIAKNPAKPFFVYANEVVTKVLGTSFRIKTFEDNRPVEVDVRTGRVSVFTQSRLRQDDQESHGVVLLPNQQALVNRTSENITKRIVDNPVPIKQVPTSSKKHFEAVSASQIFQELEAQYGVKILYNEELLTGCIITTSLGNESLRNKLDIVCQTIGATYREIDAQLVVDSNGCH